MPAKKLDKGAVCRELDFAAEKLERLGFTDLSQKVDYYSDKIRAAKDEDIPSIYRALSRIQKEHDRRTVSDPSALKAKHATERARREPDKRGLLIARKLREKDAELKKAHQEIEKLKKLVSIARKVALQRMQSKEDPEKTASERASARKARIQAILRDKK